MVFTTLATFQLKKNDDYEKIHGANLLYLMIGEVIGHIEESYGNKYLLFDSAELRSTAELHSVDENKEILKKYTELWDGIRNKIEIMNCGKTSEYSIYDSDDDLPLNKQLKFPTVTIAVRSVFQDEGKFYPGIYLAECFYEL